MDREYIMYSEAGFVYVEYINGERLRYKPKPNTSSYTLDKTSNAYVLTEDELNWIRHKLRDYDNTSQVEISPSYFYKKEIEYERDKNREVVRKELDGLRDKHVKFAPEELLKLKNENNRENKGIENFAGVYILHNCKNDKYYVGQSEKVSDRSYMHFIKGKGNAEVYEDYLLGDKFSISLISLKETSFSRLNDLEGAAIRAYNALYPYGYNKVAGNILDKPIFKNNDYKMIAEFILDKVKETEWFSKLTNNKKRFSYTYRFLSEHKLPLDSHFLHTFPKSIKVSKVV
ncbi:GIY-YIG nuclease family protein [Halobacillus karajensis]|uniref:GIY-YIG catalytic domain protein n=1 Tax=Halobacillus karajensis TaxID=195088 RepID=A0A059NXU1_9BACI|nr:hypothetical protein [Halobacillus karajensis]CDQ20344.1 GIY-YIG catalytic domain protein [Halobacillus karajensis]CDQ23588.1 GIY-YIG catalytic domain protein [Halobacillus karajensis]CDQ27070.1 GIY-YIG catalytic domain protein [Halobacillus karajensis]